MPHSEESTLPEGVFSLLDTDLYKLTMQCAILKYFPTECQLGPQYYKPG